MAVEARAKAFTSSPLTLSLSKTFHPILSGLLISLNSSLKSPQSSLLRASASMLSSLLIHSRYSFKSLNLSPSVNSISSKVRGNFVLMAFRTAKALPLLSLYKEIQALKEQRSREKKDGKFGKACQRPVKVFSKWWVAESGSCPKIEAYLWGRNSPGRPWSTLKRKCG